MAGTVVHAGVPLSYRGEGWGWGWGGGGDKEGKRRGRRWRCMVKVGMLKASTARSR